MTETLSGRPGAPATDAAAPGLRTSRSLPGGARAALEAVLMVIDEPATATGLAAGLNLTVDVVEESARGTAAGV